VAGFLAVISLRTPIYFQSLVAFMAVPAAFLLAEPPVNAENNIHSVKKMAMEIKKAISLNENLRVSILLSAVTGSATLTFAWLVQPFFKAIFLPVELFGIAWTALNLSAGISSAYAFRVAGRLKRRHETFIIVTLLAAGYLFTGLTIVREGVIFLLIFYLIRGLASPIFKNYLNFYTPNNMRATILSARDMIIRTFFAVTSPMLGWLIDNAGLNIAFIFAGGSYFFSVMFILLPWLRKNKTE
jgi:tryptophan-rich sensory protein